MTTATAHPTAITPDTVKIGQGMHTGFNGDRYPLTVLEMSASGKTIYLGHDDYKVLPGQSPQSEGDKECAFIPATRKGTVGNWVTARWNNQRGCYMIGGKSGRRLGAGRRYAHNPHI